MDPRLAYTPVAAPDFSTALQALQAAGSTFGKTFDDASGIVGDIKSANDSAANKGYQAALTQFSDPATAQAAITADPTLGFDPRRLSAASLAAGGNRAADLMALANTKVGYQKTAEDLAQTELTRGYENTDTSLFRAAQPDINAYLKAQHDDPTGASAAQVLANSSTLKALPSERYNSLLTGGQGMIKSELGLTGDRSDTGKKVFDNTQAIQDKTDSLNAISLSGDARAEVSDPAQIPKYFADHREGLLAKGMTPSAIAMAEDHAIKTLQGLPAQPGVIAPSAMGGARLDDGPDGQPTGSYDAKYGDTADGNNAYGIKSNKPISSMTAGEVYDFGRNNMTEVTKRGVGKLAGIPLGTTAVGRYQIEGQTLKTVAPSVLGANWRNMPFNAANQDKLGKAIYDQAVARGENLHKQWSSISSGDSAGLAAMGWDKAKDVIAAGESGQASPGQIANARSGAVGVVNPIVAQKAISEAVTGMKLNIQRNPNVQNIALFNQLGGDTADAATVANGLIKSGKLAGEDPKWVTAKIFQVMEANPDAHLQPAMAGALIATANRGGKTGIDELRYKMNTPNQDGLSVNIDDNMIRQNLQYFSDKASVKKTSMMIDSVNTATQGAQQSLDALNKARADYNQRKNLGKQINGKPNDLTTYATNIKTLEGGVMAYHNVIHGLDHAGDSSADVASAQAQTAADAAAALARSNSNVQAQRNAALQARLKANPLLAAAASAQSAGARR